MSKEIPNSILHNWQKIVDILAKVANVPVALIMKVERPFIEVFRSSDTPENPYQLGDREHLAGLYCERVINSNRKLLVKNALKENDWKNNPDLEYGFISYLGFPLELPDKRIFGTICILDRSENKFNKTIEDLILEFKNLIETHLQLIFKNQRLEKVLEQNKVQQEKLKNSKEEIEKAYKRADFFKKLIYHDLNNVLQNILSSTELLRKIMPPIPEISSIYEILNILEKQVSKGTVLINNTHIISNLEKEHPEMKSVNLCKILNNCIEEIKEIYNKRKIYITKLYKDQIINVKGNNLLKNVFNNILINSIEHNDNSIIIKVKCFIPDGEDICRLEFIDNGRGIPKHKKEKIFEENFKLQKNNVIK